MLGEILQIGERHTEVEVIRAGLNNVLAAARTLGGDQRLEFGVEKRLGKRIHFGGEILVAGLVERVFQLIGGEFRHELLSRSLIVIALIGPEEHREIEYAAV